MFGKLRIPAICLAVAVNSLAGEFVRVSEDPTAARLQTAVTRYEKEGVSVDLLGAVHIADKEYYEKLDQRFKSYDALLFEMIGGEKWGRQQEKIPAVEVRSEPGLESAEDSAAAEHDNMSGLSTIYDSIARYLELSGQAESIDYHASNFVHADLTLAEFRARMKVRKESIFSFALESAEHGKASQPNSFRLLRAILAGSANHVKRELIHTLGSADDQVSSISGENVVISDRNARCMEVLAREIATGHKQLGIFYGAAHFPDLAKRLEALGFKRVKHEWITAWEIPKKAKSKKSA